MIRLLTASTFAIACLAAPITASANPNGCPPGLAKKSPACVPPGQAAKAHKGGDHIDGRYVRLENPGAYGLEPGSTYYRLGDQVYRVDNETREILAAIGAIAALAD